MEILPGIHQIKTPIPNSPLGFINAYLVKTGDGCLLVDTGWNSDEAFSAMQDQIGAAGVDWNDIKYILVTHGHPDHYGLVEKLVSLTRASLIVHKTEAAFLQSLQQKPEMVVQEMVSWMRFNGVGEAMSRDLVAAWRQLFSMYRMVQPDLTVAGGEQLTLGVFQFDVLWTPGHMPGHICLYEANKRLLFSGDHVLPNIIPNAAMDSKTYGNPLANYLNALGQVKALPVDLVLPGHGDIFINLKERTAEIEEHHAERIRESAVALSSGALSGFEVCNQISWPTLTVPWNKLSDFMKQITVGETISHLELGVAQGLFEKNLRDGMAFYSKKV